MFSNIKAVRVQEIIMSGSYDVIDSSKIGALVRKTNYNLGTSRLDYKS